MINISTQIKKNSDGLCVFENKNNDIVFTATDRNVIISINCQSNDIYEQMLFKIFAKLFFELIGNYAIIENKKIITDSAVKIDIVNRKIICICSAFSSTFEISYSNNSIIFSLLSVHTNKTVIINRKDIFYLPFISFYENLKLLNINYSKDSAKLYIKK